MRGTYNKGDVTKLQMGSRTPTTAPLSRPANSLGLPMARQAARDACAPVVTSQPLLLLVWAGRRMHVCKPMQNVPTQNSLQRCRCGVSKEEATPPSSGGQSSPHHGWGVAAVRTTGILPLGGLLGRRLGS